jgi:hypothetical protein
MDMARIWLNPVFAGFLRAMGKYDSIYYYQAL